MTNYWLTKLLYFSYLVTSNGFLTNTFKAFVPTSGRIFHASTSTPFPQATKERHLRTSTALPYIDQSNRGMPDIATINDAVFLGDASAHSSKIEQTSLADMDITVALPVIVRPKTSEQKSRKYLSRFLHEHKHWIDTMLTRKGAVMFRGFDIDTAQDVQDTIQSYNPILNNQYRGTSPRNTQGGTKYVFSAAEVPSHWPIAQHIEMSFLPSPPKQLYFSALEAPQSIGGETAVADFRKVYQDIPTKLRKKLAAKKLLYTRTHHKVGEQGDTHDVAAMLGWPELFGTSDPSEVEKLAAVEGMPMRWEGNDQDIFVSQFRSEPFQLHPTTKEPVFFNHANVFHWTSFPAELFAAFRRTRDWRFLAHGLKVAMKSVMKYRVLRQKMAMEIAFGDGTPISIHEMHQIRKAIHKNMVFTRWEKGDLLLLDNFSTSHGRQPTYDKGRNIVVAWSDPFDKNK